MRGSPSHHSGRRGARASAAFFGAVVALTDFLPPSVRYGYVHRMTRVFRTALPAVRAGSALRNSDSERGIPPVVRRLTCVLAADHLDVGGIGSVIEMLALRLRDTGVEPVVVCHGDGERARRLRHRGVRVLSVSDDASAAGAISVANPRVIELHSAPAYIERAAFASGVPLVTAMHNTEIHFTTARWRSFANLLAGSSAGVAVSEIVREFHARHVPEELAARIVVIPNGAPQTRLPDTALRASARKTLEAALGSQIGDDIVFLCLARYDAQKNVTGTVASFLRAAEVRDDIRLVCAGEPSDWAELRRADGYRRADPRGDRVHLLANSDATTLLAAADAFLLNSFFEGWPVAATEAAAIGLPLILSDVGGAAELVRRDPTRSVLVSNATGEASAVSDARVRVARRQSRAQSNRDEVVCGILAVAGTVRRATPPAERGDADRAGIDAMVAAHADVLRAAAGGETP